MNPSTLDYFTPILGIVKVEGCHRHSVKRWRKRGWHCKSCKRNFRK